MNHSIWTVQNFFIYAAHDLFIKIDSRNRYRFEIDGLINWMVFDSGTSNKYMQRELHSHQPTTYSQHGRALRMLQQQLTGQIVEHFYAPSLPLLSWIQVSFKNFHPVMCVLKNIYRRVDSFAIISFWDTDNTSKTYNLGNNIWSTARSGSGPIFPNLWTYHLSKRKKKKNNK